MIKFNYLEAFKRNIGILTQEEQLRLKEFTIAIPGMGGVGGEYLISLVRQGFEKFKIADIDEYEMKNFNRQYGANMKTLGKKKIDVMKQMALDINPNCQFEVYEHGLNQYNLDDFLSNVDLAIDGLDFFVIEIKRKYFMKIHEKRIPSIVSVPLGLSGACLVFMPEGPSFDEYFGITDDMSVEQQVISFGVGVAPRMLQNSYIRGVHLEEKRGPSSIVGIHMCASMVVANALKILLRKGKINAVPNYQQFDLMKNKFVQGKIPLGNKNPLQKLKIKVGLQLMKKRN